MRSIVDLCAWDTRVDFEVFWLKTLGVSLITSLDPTLGPPRMFIVDEAQKTFGLGPSHRFWQALKGINVLHDQRTSQVQILLLGVYCTFTSPGGAEQFALATPVEIRNGWSLPFLSLDAAETAELFCAYNASCNVHLRPKLSGAVQNSMLHFCGAHVGLLRSAMVRFASVFRSHPADLTSSQEAAFIREELIVLGTGGNMRALPRLSRLSEADARWLKSVALEGPEGYRLHAGESVDDDLARLISVGVFDFDDSCARVRFSSRLMQTHALQQLFGASAADPIAITLSMTAIDLSREVVKRLDRRTLLESLSASAKGTLVERQYQMTFFA